MALFFSLYFTVYFLNLNRYHKCVNDDDVCYSNCDDDFDEFYRCAEQKKISRFVMRQ